MSTVTVGTTAEAVTAARYAVIDAAQDLDTISGRSDAVAAWSAFTACLDDYAALSLAGGHEADVITRLRVGIHQAICAGDPTSCHGGACQVAAQAAYRAMTGQHG